MIYSIYHIKGIKIGCTSNIKNRVIKQQGYSYCDFNVMYATTNKIEASYIEKYLQIKFNYKQDKNLYHKLKLKKMENLFITKQSITLVGSYDKELTGFILPKKIQIEDEIIPLNQEDYNWILKNNYQSQHNKERYFYTNAFIKYIKNKNQHSMEFECNKTIFEKIRIWAEERGIYDKGDVKTQYIKLQEESGELAKAILNEDQEEIIDAIGDIGVVLTNLSYLCGYSIEECLESAYNVIKTRKGKMENGTFIKEELLQQKK